MPLTTREREACTRGLIFGWKTALLIWGLLYSGELIHGGLFAEFYGTLLNYIKVNKFFCLTLVFIAQKSVLQDKYHR